MTPNEFYQVVSGAPKTRRKSKMKENSHPERRVVSRRPARLETGQNKSTRSKIDCTNKRTPHKQQQQQQRQRPKPQPQGAFFYRCSSTRFLLMLSLFVSSVALFMLVAVVDAGSSKVAPQTGGHTDRAHSNSLDRLVGDAGDDTLESSIGHHGSDHRFANKFSSTYRHLTSRQKREQQRQQQRRQLQQDHLKYLIAKTSLMPRFIDHKRYEQASRTADEQYQRHIDHMENNIDSAERSHPNSVHRFWSKPSVSPATRYHQQRSRGTSIKNRQPYFDHTHKELERKLGRYSVDDDIESLPDDGGRSESDLIEFDDVEDVADEDDDDDDDDDDDYDEDEGVDEEEEEGPEASKEEVDESIGQEQSAHSDNNIVTDDQDTTPIDSEEASNNNHVESNNLGAKSPHSRSSGWQGNQSHSFNHLNGNSNWGKRNNSWNQSSNPSSNESLKKSYRRRHNEFDSESNEMVTAAIPVRTGGSARQVHPLHKQKSQPPVPYPSPVVVSISDNSFVSASPVSVDTNRVNDVDVVEGPKSSDEAKVHYSHIIAGPKNELPSYGRRYWHDSHMASIQMVQEVSSSG
jgi:hypothetical protein